MACQCGRSWNRGTLLLPSPQVDEAILRAALHTLKENEKQQKKSSSGGGQAQNEGYDVAAAMRASVTDDMIDAVEESVQRSQERKVLLKLIWVRLLLLPYHFFLSSSFLPRSFHS